VEKERSVSLEDVLAVAKKYYQWSFPLIPSGFRDEIKKVINWDPEFNGKRPIDKLAVNLSYDVSFLLTQKGASGAACALACAAFEISHTEAWASVNLGTAISNFCDDNTDEIKRRRGEIYADSETAFLYALGITTVSKMYTAGSVDPLVSLGTLYLDMGKLEDAKIKFDEALKIKRGHPPAIAGLNAYYAAKGMPQMSGIVKKMAKESPTVLGKAFNEIVERTNDVPSRKKEITSEEAQIQYMKELIKVEPVTYADIFKEADPKTAKRSKEKMKELIGEMKLKIPNVTVLTQYTDINEDNMFAIASATRAVADEINHLSQYVITSQRKEIHAQANMFDRMNVNANFMGMGFSDFMRDAANNPKKYENASFQGDMSGIQNELQTKALSYADELMKNLNKMMSGGTPDNKDVSNMFKMSGKTEPIMAVQGVNPFDYANPWDVIIQQFNAKLLQEKLNAFGTYMTTVVSDANELHISLMNSMSKEMDELIKQQNAQERMIQEMYKDDQHMQRIQMHRTVHLPYLPRYTNINRRYFIQMTQNAAVAYKKLEDHIPEMYQTVMSHLVYISDPKVQQEYENRLIGTIAANLMQVIQMLLASYGVGKVRDPRDCGCDEEELRNLEAERTAREKQEGNAKVEKQKKAVHDFKNGVVDQKSSYYKNRIKPYESEWDLIIVKYRSNDHFSAKEGGVWTPFGSIKHSSIKNHFTGETTGSNKLSINVPLGPVTVSGKWEVDYVRGKDGTIHPNNLDRRTSIEVSAGYGPMSASAGISFTSRGTRVYGNAEFTGNDYLDGLKEAAAGGLGGWANIEAPSKKVWDGSYTFE